MADFDAILKEVQALRDEHLSLQVLIPKLAEEAKGLRLSIVDAQKELIQIEEQQQNLVAESKAEIDRLNSNLAVSVQSFIEEKQNAEQSIEEANKDINERLAVLLGKEANFSAKENELANLLQKQVDGNNALQERLIQFEQRVGEHLKKEATFKRESEELEENRDKVGLLILTLSDEQTALARDRIEVDNMTREAQALLKTAQKKSGEATEQNNLLQLRIDEYNRKDELLKDSGKRLRKREIAINDKERVYNSR